MTYPLHAVCSQCGLDADMLCDEQEADLLLAQARSDSGDGYARVHGDCPVCGPTTFLATVPEAVAQDDEP